MSDIPQPVATDLSFAEDDLAPFNVAEHSGRRAMVLLFASLGGLLALALAVFYLYQPGTRDRADPPLIAAGDQPFKTRPSDAGGIETPNQDIEVYGRVNGSDGRDTGIRIAPQTEEPILVEPSTIPPLTMPDSANILTPDTVPSPQPARPARPQQQVAERPASRPDPTPAAPAPVASGSITSGTGEWVVQVASLRSNEEAQATWGRVSSKFASTLPSGAYADIQRADLAEKGIYHRLRVAGLADKSAANGLCAQFKAGGQDCFVKRR